MAQSDQHEHVQITEMKRKRSFARTSLAVLAGIVIFGLGMNIGNGNISFSRGPHNVGNTSLPAELDYQSVNTLYKSLKENYDGTLTESQLLDGLKEGLAQATHDPYTEYFTPKEAQAFKNQLSGTFSGIGAQLGKDSDNNLEVIAPIAGTPADKAGLKAKDIITHINSESTSGMSIDTAVEKIRGKKGTNVTLKIVRDKEQALSLTITRDDINIPSVTTKTLDGNIGYIQISQFGDDTGELTSKAAQSFKDAGVKGIILDLRSNPGGRLDAAVEVSDLWVPAGKTILQEKQGSTVVESYTASAGGPLEGMPTVVLIDGGSASASEITAGALKDNNAATLIGTKSYGKGVVQQVIPFKDGSELKVTVASWYRPNGQNINKKGITPDTEVKVSDSDIAAKNDTQLQAAQQKLANQ
jgi:carboxyl-terminal processing protease